MKKFIKPWKSVKKDIGPTALNAVVRGAGGVAGAFAQNKLGPKLPETLQKHKGVAAFLLGTVIDVFADQPQMKAFGQGVAVSGVMSEAITFVGADVKPLISLQGIDAPTTDTVDWDALRKKAEQDAVNGINYDDPDNVNGLDQDEFSNPAENL